MRVLFWTLNFWPNIGGIEVLAAKLVPALRHCGHEFLVVTPKSPPELPEQARYRGVPIFRLPFQNLVTPATIDHLIMLRDRVIAIKREFRPDLVHINGVGAADFFHLTTENAHAAPLLVTLHGAWERNNDTIVRHTLRAADWVCGCSAAILERGIKLAPEIAARSSIIYNGIDVPTITPEPLAFESPRLICVGRLAPEKGIDLALAAFPSILARYPKARLVIVGDGPLRYALKEQSHELGIDRAVDFTGWVAPDHIPDLLNTATMLLMPSRHDSLPLAALESALMGRPIVAARVGGLPEVVAHKETGLLFQSENSDALAAAVVSLLADPHQARQYGRAARDRARELFSWGYHVNAYDALYRKLGSVHKANQAQRTPGASS
jgi:glycogen(starch) synthase